VQWEYQLFGGKQPTFLLRRLLKIHTYAMEWPDVNNSVPSICAQARDASGITLFKNLHSTCCKRI
jgi:hypothetical protein